MCVSGPDRGDGSLLLLLCIRRYTPILGRPTGHAVNPSMGARSLPLRGPARRSAPGVQMGHAASRRVSAPFSPNAANGPEWRPSTDASKVSRRIIEKQKPRSRELKPKRNLAATVDVRCRAGSKAERPASSTARTRAPATSNPNHHARCLRNCVRQTRLAIIRR